MLRRLLAPPARFVLAIGNEGGLLLQLAGGELRGRWQVAGLDEAALRTLAAALAKAPRCPLVVVGDLLEQSYRKEPVPRLNRRDRAKVLKRRLERAFPETPLKAALKLADDPEEPRRQNYLLVGLPPAADWDRWLGFLRSIDNPVLPLTLLPVEAAAMVSRLARALAPADRPAHSWAVLISRQSTGGVRQFVVHQGELALTRLTPSLGADAGPAEVAVEIRRELKATLGYMTRLGYRAGSSLDTLVLGGAGLAAELDGSGSMPGRLTVIAAADAARALGLDLADRRAGAGIEDADGALLGALWVGRQRRPALQLLPADLRLRRRQGQALRWASAGLAASALGLCGYAALSALSALQIKQEVSWLSAWQGTTRQQLERSEGDADAIAARAQQMRVLLEAHRRLDATRASPFAALAALRRVLARDEQLSALAWQAVEAADGQRRAPAAGPDFTLDLTLDLGPAAEPAAAVATTEDLASRLTGTFPERSVAIVRQAVDILPQQAFVGSIGADAPAAPDARLSAQIHVGTRLP
jgi:hypothetical protein